MQTFATLEKSLQDALEATAPPQMGARPAGRILSLEAAWGLLEFMNALEKNIAAATEGSMARSEPQDTATQAFFRANQKVSILHELC